MDTSTSYSTPLEKPRLSMKLSHLRNLFVMTLLIAAIPLTVFLSNQEQDVRQNAEELSVVASMPTVEAAAVTTFDKAVKFDGVSSRVEYKATGFAISPSLTVEGWINPEQEPEKPITSYRPTVIASIALSTQTCKNAFNIFLTRGDASNSNYKINAAFESGGLLIDPGVISYGGWTHVAFTVSSTNEAKLYVNGKLKATKVLPSAMCDPKLGVVMGALVNGTNITPNSHFKGLMDEVHIMKGVKYSADFTPQGKPFDPLASTTLLLHFNGTLQNSSSIGGDAVAVNTITYVDSTIPVSDNIPPAMGAVTTASNHPVSLPSASLGVKYRVLISASDKNLGDKLTMTISNLPSGLTPGPCTGPTASNVITCEIIGTPMKTEQKLVEVKISDGKEEIVKKMVLNVAFYPIPTPSLLVPPTRTP